MSFRFQWPEFSAEFHALARQQLEIALNKDSSQRPAHICDDILVKELQMGTTPPELEMLEIGELSLEKFRGMFRLTYSGDAYLVLQTKVQVNPVTPTTTHPSRNASGSFLTAPYRHGMLTAHKPLVVPMLLKISQLRLRGITTLVVDKQKGVTLSFKNDPLESVQVSSTFDELQSVKNMLQGEIEKQLRELFVEEIPSVIHQLSLKSMGLREQTVEEALRRSAQRVPLSRDSGSSGGVSVGGSSDSGLGASMESQELVEKVPEEPVPPARTPSPNPLDFLQHSLPGSPLSPRRKMPPTSLDSLHAPSGKGSPIKRSILFASLPSLVQTPPKSQQSSFTAATTTFQQTKSYPSAPRSVASTTALPRNAVPAHDILAVPSRAASEYAGTPPPRRSTSVLLTSTAPSGISSLLDNNGHRRTSRSDIYRPTRSILSRYNDARFVDTEHQATSSTSHGSATILLRPPPMGKSISTAATSENQPSSVETTSTVLPSIRRSSSDSSNLLYAPDTLQKHMEAEQKARQVLDTRTASPDRGNKKKQWVWVVHQ